MIISFFHKWWRYFINIFLINLQENIIMFDKCKGLEDMISFFHKCTMYSCSSFHFEISVHKTFFSLALEINWNTKTIWVWHACQYMYIGEISQHLVFQHFVLPHIYGKGIYDNTFLLSTVIWNCHPPSCCHKQLCTSVLNVHKCGYYQVLFQSSRYINELCSLTIFRISVCIFAPD